MGDAEWPPPLPNLLECVSCRGYWPCGNSSATAKRFLWEFVELGFASILAIMLLYLILGQSSGVFVLSVADNVTKFASAVPTPSLIGLAADSGAHLSDHEPVAARVSRGGCARYGVRTAWPGSRNSAGHRHAMLL